MKLVSKMKSSESFKTCLFYGIIFFLFVYVFCVPSFGESTSFVRYSIYASMAILGGAAILYCYLYDDFRVNKAILFVPLFCVFSLIGTLLYSHQYRTWFSLVLLTVSFFVFVYSFKAIKNKYLTICVISLALFLFSIYFIAYYRKEIMDFRSYTSDLFRLGWYFDNPNGVSAFAVIGFASPLYLILFWKNKYRLLFVFPGITSLLVGITTGSRTFFVIVVIVLIIFLYFKFSRHKIAYLVTLAGLIVLGTILINLPFLSTMRDRLIRAFETLFGTPSKVDTSTLERAVMIDYGFSLGSKRLFFGYGVDGFSLISGMGTYAHSNFAEMVCDFGLFGLVLFYLPLILFFFKTIGSKKVDKCFVLTLLIYYFIVSFSNVIYYKKIYYLMLAFLFYLVYIDGSTLTKKVLVPELRTIVFTCDSMGSGGAEKVIASLSNEMSKEFNVCVVGVADVNAPSSFYELGDKVEYITLKNKNGKRIRPLKRIFVLRKTIKQLKPDVVISFLPNANIYTWLSLMFTGIPHITSERNNPRINPKGKVTRTLKKLSFMFSNGSVFQTNDAMNYYPSCVIKKGSVIKNPIVIKHTPKPNNRNKTVLAVGRLNEQKNYKCLITAFSYLNIEKNNEYILKIYGEGVLKTELLEYSKSLHIENKVLFMGSDPDWQEKEFDDAMYVLSSNYEGMPNSLAEAMAIGIPSIATDCPTGGCRDLINDGVNGHLVPIDDPESLAKTMINLSNNETDTFYESTRNLVSDYSVKTISAQWIKFIKCLSKEYYE